MRRLHHGHSLIAGALVCLLLQRHAFLFALLIFAAGVAVGRAWLTWARVGTAARRYFDRKAKRAQARARAHVGAWRGDDIPF